MLHVCMSGYNLLSCNQVSLKMAGASTRRLPAQPCMHEVYMQLMRTGQSGTLLGFLGAFLS